MEQQNSTDLTSTALTSSAPSASQAASSLNSHLIGIINPLIVELGYEVVQLEVQTHRNKVLRIFIDRITQSEPLGAPIGIEDCVRVSRALDEPLDQHPEMEGVFKGSYELEVSSPGVDRPLRQRKDFARFAGKEVRIHVFRPLTAEELGNPVYQLRNPKQKNFLGSLIGMVDEFVVLKVEGEIQLRIPFSLIAKANLEPKFQLGDREP